MDHRKKEPHADQEENHNHHSQEEHTHHDHHDHKNHDESHDEHEHDNHGHGAHDHHGHMVTEFRNKFSVVLIFTIPILLLSPMIQDFMGVDWSFIGDIYILAALSVFVYFYGCCAILTGYFDELTNNGPGIKTLGALSISIAFFYSLAVVFGFNGEQLFWELATLVLIMLLGHWIEMRSINNASKALESLASLMPNTANRIAENGETEEVQVDAIKAGDLLLVKP